MVEKFTLLKLFIIEEFFSNVEKTALAAVVEFNLRHSAVGSINGKVDIFWEGHKNLAYLPLLFDTFGSVELGGRQAKF